MSSILSLTQYEIGGDELGLIELFDYIQRIKQKNTYSLGFLIVFLCLNV